MQQNQESRDLSVVWENSELNLEAIEADAEKDIKPDIQELNKILLASNNATSFNGRAQTRLDHLRASIVSVSQSRTEIEESLNSTKDQLENAYNEHKALERECTEFCFSSRIDIEKMEDRLLSLKLDCDNKLIDEKFEEERYSCDAVIQQRQCDLLRDYSRKIILKSSNKTKEGLQYQNDLKKEYDLQSELDKHCENLEKDLDMLQNTNENLEKSLTQLEKSVDIVIEDSMELKEKLAVQNFLYDQLQQENQRLQSRNKYFKEGIDYLESQKVQALASTVDFQNECEGTSHLEKLSIVDTQMETTRESLKMKEKMLQVSEAELECYQQQMTEWLANKAELEKIQSLLTNKNDDFGKVDKPRTTNIEYNKACSEDDGAQIGEHNVN
jgi:hypothetical protein